MKNYFSLLFVFLSQIAFCQESSFDVLAAKVNEFAAKSQWDELLVAAPELITADPSKPHGYYFTALAFHKIQADDKALEYIAMAEQNSDNEFAGKIESLKAEITRSTTVSRVSESIAATGGGTRTAEDFQKLWEADRRIVDNGWSAVELYVDREDYVEALAILSDPAMAGEQARAAISGINKKPKMIAYNGYHKAMKEAVEQFDKESFGMAITKYNDALKFYPNDAKAISGRRKAQEEYDWNEAGSTNTVESFKKYLSKYTYGVHRRRADEILQATYLKWARQNVTSGNFDDASKYYLMYQTEYPSGPSISTVNKELCELYFAEAQRVEQTKSASNMGLALQYYKQSQSCGIDRVSPRHLKYLARKEREWSREEIGFFGWHADERNFIGCISGSLNNRKLGIYFSARTGTGLFKSGNANWKTDSSNSLEESVDKDKSFNHKIYNQTIYANLGITKKVIYPFWIYAGAGVCSQVELREFQHNVTGDIENVVNKENKYVAFNPEVGLHINLNVITIQYGINKPLNSMFKDDFVQHFGLAFKM